jgi:AhpD family alkylhydroperoxidase
MMMDWNAYRNALLSTLGQIGEISPDILKANAIVSAATPAKPTLSPKLRELVAMAVAVTTRCDGCITVHADAARKAGATKEELVEVLGIAIALNTGAALVYSARAVDAFQASGAS